MPRLASGMMVVTVLPPSGKLAMSVLYGYGPPRLSPGATPPAQFAVFPHALSEGVNDQVALAANVDADMPRTTQATASVTTMLERLVRRIRILQKFRTVTSRALQAARVAAQRNMSLFTHGRCRGGAAKHRRKQRQPDQRDVVRQWMAYHSCILEYQGWPSCLDKCRMNPILGPWKHHGASAASNRDDRPRGGSCGFPFLTLSLKGSKTRRRGSQESQRGGTICNRSSQREIQRILRQEGQETNDRFRNRKSEWGCPRLESPASDPAARRY